MATCKTGHELSSTKSTERAAARLFAPLPLHRSIDGLQLLLKLVDGFNGCADTARVALANVAWRRDSSVRIAALMCPAKLPPSAMC